MYAFSISTPSSSFLQVLWRYGVSATSANNNSVIINVMNKGSKVTMMFVISKETYCVKLVKVL